jgi:ATP-dependent Clp protease ATP-binding subunit ClpC
MLEKTKTEKDEAISARQYEYAGELRDRESKLSEKLAEMQSKWQEEKDKEKPVVTRDNIEEVVSMWTGIPVTRLSTDETARLVNMEEELHKSVVGQEEPITLISKAVRRARSGIKDPKRPVGVFIFSGPTGVGKTYLPKKLAEFMFGSEDAVVRIDMSEFMERHSVSRLVGAPPGYVGYEEGGQLTEAVRRKSYCLILLDEIEKAHPEVFNLLLQIFDDGHLTDAKGRKVDFRNAIIVMTSNIGSDLIRQDRTLGFTPHAEGEEKAKNNYERMKENVLDEIKRFFRPEFLNRIDGTVVFHALSEEHMGQIVDIMLKDVAFGLIEKGISLEVSDAAKQWIAEKGYDPLFGARPLRRVIQDHLEDKMSDAILGGSFSPGDTAMIDVDEDEITVKTQSPMPVGSA